LANVKELVLKEPTHLSNWATLYYHKLVPTAEVSIIGSKAPEMRAELSSFYIPEMLVLGSIEGSSKVPLLEGRTAIDEKTTIYVCYNKSCQFPVHSADKALEQLLKPEQKSKFPSL
ncbi:MAG: thioredoxin domain-containing protein, partial [Pontibacter sp.]|nr:thioredoxin domain-containing protein [Pontibacter sp.]